MTPKSKLTLGYLLLATGFEIISGVVYTCPRANKPCKCSKDFTKITCQDVGLTEIPKNIPAPVETLNLARNSISMIESGAFFGLENLTSLDLRRSQVKTIKVGAFRGLGKLKILYLTGNGLSTMLGSHSQDIPMLQYLYLGQNQFTSIPDVGTFADLEGLLLERNELSNAKFPAGFLSLRKFKHFGLSNNNLGQIKKDDFASLVNAPITKISLSRDKLSKIEAGSFKYFSKTLTSLKISYNSLSGEDIRNLCDDLGKGRLFTSLNFDGMSGFKMLPVDTFRGFQNSSLRQLSFRHTNGIGKIASGTFVYLKKLFRLDISYSKVQMIAPEAFKGLDSLQQLVLNKNDINGLPHSLPKSLREVNLADNRISKIPDGFFAGMVSLWQLNLMNNNILKLGPQSFAGLEHLRFLNLSGNHIDGAGVETFSPLRKLRSLSLNSNRLTKIVNNPRIFEKLSSLEYLDLSDNACSVLPMYVFKNLKHLKMLKLGKNELGGLIRDDKKGELFAGLDHLEQLDLRMNNIQELTDGVLRPLKGMKKLELGRNSISAWGSATFLSQNRTLQHLNLSNNNVATISKSSMSTLTSLVTLTLTGNPFSCDCGLVWFRRWIDHANVTFPGLKSYQCNSPPIREGLLLLKFDPNSLTCIDLFPYVLGGSIGGAVILCLVMTLVMYRYRWFIKLRAYRFGQAMRNVAHPPEYEPIPGDDLHFDAYISNHRDSSREFVLGTLLPVFDNGEGYNGAYRLCFDERDFEPGEYVLTNITNNIAQSQRGLIILTPEYIHDKFYELELHMLLEEANKRPFTIIVIELVEIPPNRVPNGLRRIFEARNQLTWSENPDEQALFKDRLTNKLERRPQCLVDAAVAPAPQV